MSPLEVKLGFSGCPLGCPLGGRGWSKLLAGVDVALFFSLGLGFDGLGTG